MSAPTHIKDLKPDPDNLRVHNPRNLGVIVDALNEVGAARSIVIDENDVVLAGNGVLEGAAEAGIERVRVVEADGQEIIAVRRRGLSSEQKKRLALYDNRAGELSEWDNAKLAQLAQAGGVPTGLFLESEMRKIIAASGITETAHADDGAVPDERDTNIVAGDVFDLGEQVECESCGQWWTVPSDGDAVCARCAREATGRRRPQHRLLCGDSTDVTGVMSLLGDERADCVFTSPPYAVGIDYGDYKDTIENLRALLPRMAECWLSALLPGGFAVVNFGDIVSAKEIVGADEVCEYPTAVEYWPVFRAAGYTLWSRRIWCKPAARTHSLHSISSNRAATNWEHIWTWKKRGHPVVDFQIAGPYASQFGWLDTSNDESPEISAEVHGASMPVATARWMLTTHCREKAVVLEPFCGTGTTVIAAEELGRRCYAIELRPAFAQVTIDRWQAFTGKPARKVL